jgi:superfamily II DNA helicase RecQ
VQRYCDGCRRVHALDAFDLDGDEANAVCRAYSRRQERTVRADARRKLQSKIEALEQRRRGLIAALVQIDQEIAKERSLQVTSSSLYGTGEAEDVFGGDGDREPGPGD